MFDRGQISLGPHILAYSF